VLEYAIRPVAPYDLGASARGFGDGTRAFRDGVFVQQLRDGVAHVRQRGDGSLVVRAPTEEAFERTAWVLGADVDHQPFLELAARDPLLRDVIHRRRGVRVLRTVTVAHALLKAMCGQLIQASAAIQIERDVLRHLFARDVRPPERDDLAGLSAPRVASLGLAPRRADALVRIARTLDLDRLHAHPTAAVVARLCREPQLGPWSAGVVSLYGLGRPEAGLVGDLGLVKLAAALWGRRVEGHETAALLEPYGPWAGLASAHLLAISGRTTVARRPAAARAGSRAAG
jgi:AraC family transcriptional regulator of adaptative response / DNA-3-methyladenine glycosylase II